jgi:hypothetical protein
MLVHITVEEADLRADDVFLFPLPVRSTVQFDDQLAFEAEEIGDESLQRRLSAEFESAEAAVADVPPKFFFCGRGIVAHAPRAVQKDGIHRDFRIKRHRLSAFLFLLPRYSVGEG